MDVARLGLDGHERFMGLLTLGVWIAGDDLDGVDLALKLRVFHLPRGDLAVDAYRAFVLVDGDGFGRFLVCRRDRDGSQ